MKLLCMVLLAFSSMAQAADTSAAKATGNDVTVAMKVTEKGFEPADVKIKPGQFLTLNITRTTETTCAKEVQIPSKHIKAELPLNKMVSIKVGKLKKGEVRYGCGMDMMEGGKILVE